MNKSEFIRRERILSSKNFNGKSFQNLNVQNSTINWRKDFTDLSKLYLFSTQGGFPPKEIPIINPKPTWHKKKDSKLRVTWLGHSTLLIELNNKTILTDPVFGLRASPTSYFGPKRFHPVPIKLDELPKIDLVLISHDHYDHLCVNTVSKLAALNIPIVTSLGVGSLLEKCGVPCQNIIELDWYEEAQMGDIRFISTPSQHFSGRGLFDKNQTLWSSWVLDDGWNKVFFSGDTGLHDEFVNIKNNYGPFDLILLEIGAYHPTWSDIHLGPENAAKAFTALGGGTLIPIHWGTFNLSIHAWNEPAETLYSISNLSKLRVVFPMVGEPIEISQHEERSPWWRL